MLLFLLLSNQNHRAWVTLPPVSDSDHDIDLIDIGQYAHVELDAVDENGLPISDNKPRTLNVADLTGDYTATLHIGQSDTLMFAPNASSHIAFDVIIYEVGDQHTSSIGTRLPHYVKTQYLHLRVYANYFLLPWKIHEEISRRSMLFHN